MRRKVFRLIWRRDWSSWGRFRIEISGWLAAYSKRQTMLPPLSPSCLFICYSSYSSLSLLFSISSPLFVSSSPLRCLLCTSPIPPSVPTRAERCPPPPQRRDANWRRARDLTEFSAQINNCLIFTPIPSKSYRRALQLKFRPDFILLQRRAPSKPRRFSP